MSETLEKILQSQGFGTRRYCRNLVLDGDVEIDGVVHTDPSQRLETQNLVLTVCGETWHYHEHLYLVLNKPANYECSHKPRFHPSIYKLLPEQFINRGVQCVGRLDFDTTGLILLSDDGQFIHRYTSPKKKVPKIYDVTTEAPIDAQQIHALQQEMLLEGEKKSVQAVHCEQTSENTLSLAISEGQYHQVKRMVAYCGNHVVALHRRTIGAFNLASDLEEGKWRLLEEADIKKLETNTFASASE